MSTKLFYNNQQILSGQPTPLVARQDGMILAGERWADQVQITLQGQITGCVLDFNGLVEEQERLLSIFSKDFQSFKVEENGETVFSLPYVQVQSVRFPSSNYVGLIDYEISLQGYPENLFSGYFGVLDPADSWEYQETEDKRLRVSRTVSARGFNTTSGASNAYQNALDFVNDRTGNGEFLKPYFIHVPTGLVPCIKTIKREMNRFNGTYKVSLTYEADLYYNTQGVLRYNTKFDCSSSEGVAKVSVDGQIDGCASSSIEDMRTRYRNFNVYGAALEAYTNATARVDLNQDYLRSGVTEDKNIPRLNFQAEFDNFTGANVFFNYSAVVNSGDNDLVNVSIDGTIGARGDIQTRWDRVQTYYSNLSLFPYAEDAYESVVGAYPISLNPLPLTSGVSFNQFASQIRTNATWDNRQSPVDGFSSLDYSLDFGPSLQKVSSRPLASNSLGPICQSEYYVVDLGFKNRCVFSMNGNGKLDCDTNTLTAIAALKTFANTQFSTYCPSTRATLDKYVISTGFNTVSFNFSWSAESPNNVVNPKVEYSEVNNLSLK